MFEDSSSASVENPKTCYNSNNEKKKPFLKKGGGGGISCSNKARLVKISEDALSRKEQMVMSEKLQQDHLDKLEARRKKKLESKQSRQRLLFKSTDKGNGETIDKLSSPLAAQPPNASNCSILESCCSIGTKSELEEEGQRRHDCESARTLEVSVGSAPDERFTIIVNDDQVQVQRLKRRLAIALREAERERQAVHRWSEEQRRAIETWTSNQRDAIKKERHMTEKSAMLVERAQRSLSEAEFSKKHHGSEVDALKATIEKMKIERSKQEQKTQKQEMLLRERIKKMVVRINELEEHVLGIPAAKTSYGMHSSQTTRANDMSATSVSEKLAADRSPLEEGHAHPTGDKWNNRDLTPVDIYAIPKNHQRSALPEDNTVKNGSGDCIMDARSASSSEIYSFSNGDTEQVLSDGSVIYYYSEIATTHTSYQDGLQVFLFPNGQKEKHFSDGRIEIYYPDSTQKIVYNDGATEVIFPDGLRLTEGTDGIKHVSQT